MYLLIFVILTFVMFHQPVKLQTANNFGFKSNGAIFLSRTLHNPEYRIEIKLMIKIFSKLKKKITDIIHC